MGLSPTNCPHTNLGVWKVDALTVAKSGNATRMGEAAAMKLVRSKTSVPVPKVFNAYIVEETNDPCILMEFVEGDVLRDVWDDMTHDEKASIVSQLKGFMDELRSIKGEFIGAVDETPCVDRIFEGNSSRYGPYGNEAEFHEGLIAAMKISQENVWVDMVAEFIRAMPKHEIVLTHSDLAPRNIIVRGGKVVAILDWEYHGFYPAYWEYVKACYRPDWSSGWMKERVVERIMQQYTLEHAVLLHTRDIVW
ncbi:hypothetical protein HYFRA_00001844 [Hymenoscyphus fraxineus]|uniref:Aminoglycoside phosphotransferase domain-containing protein n=1 Tax=Hymenoscyphus fraxineus TaxID=746836 RepID=A0A9N9KKN8_9HELO|nr:hypothetical protein HYFRA_00001844 [Hymenoscyphus fraxineus]